MGGEEQDTHREVLASFLLSRAMANGSVYFVTEAKGFVWSLHGTPAALLSCFFGIDGTTTKREEMIQQKMSISTITRKRHGLASMRHIEEAIHHSDDGNGGERGCDGGGGGLGGGGGGVGWKLKKVEDK